MAELFNKYGVLSPDGMAVLIAKNDEQEKSRKSKACSIFYTDKIEDIGKSLTKANSMQDGESFVLNLWSNGHWAPIKFERANGVNHVIVMDSFATKGFDPDERRPIKEKMLPIDKWTRSSEIMAEITEIAAKAHITKSTKVYCNTFAIQADGTNCGIFTFKTGKKMSRVQDLHKRLAGEKYAGSFKEKAKLSHTLNGIEITGFIIPEDMVGLAQFSDKQDKAIEARKIYKDRIHYKDEIVHVGKTGAPLTLDQYWGSKGSGINDPIQYFRKKYMNFFASLERQSNPGVDQVVQNAKQQWNINQYINPKATASSTGLSNTAASNTVATNAVSKVAPAKPAKPITASPITFSNQAPPSESKAQVDIAKPREAKANLDITKPNDSAEKLDIVKSVNDRVKNLKPGSKEEGSIKADLGLSEKDKIMKVRNNQIQIAWGNGKLKWESIENLYNDRIERDKQKPKPPSKS